MLLLRLIWVFVRALFARKADLIAENPAPHQQLALEARDLRADGAVGAGAGGPDRLRLAVSYVEGRGELFVIVPTA